MKEKEESAICVYMTACGVGKQNAGESWATTVVSGPELEERLQHLQREVQEQEVAQNVAKGRLMQVLQNQFQEQNRPKTSVDTKPAPVPLPQGLMFCLGGEYCAYA